MNVIKYTLCALLFLCAEFCISQNKEDVYFILENDNKEYFFFDALNRGSDYFTIYDRKEYEYHQRRVKEAKAKGEYYFDPESGRDNLGIEVSKLTFKILSKREIDFCSVNKLYLVDYKWITENSWKKLDPTQGEASFNNLFFLYKIKDSIYIQYKVAMTIVVH